MPPLGTRGDTAPREIFLTRVKFLIGGWTSLRKEGGMSRALFILTLLFALGAPGIQWAAGGVSAKAGNMWDPNGATTEAGNQWDPNGATADAGGQWDPDGAP